MKALGIFPPLSKIHLYCSLYDTSATYYYTIIFPQNNQFFFCQERQNLFLKVGLFFLQDQIRIRPVSDGSNTLVTHSIYFFLQKQIVVRDLLRLGRLHFKVEHLGKANFEKKITNSNISNFRCCIAEFGRGSLG